MKLIILTVVLVVNQTVFAQFFTGTLYMDSREFNTVTLEGQREFGPVQVYGFIDFFTPEWQSTNLSDVYGELKLATHITGPHRVLYEYNDGVGTPIHRFGYQADVNTNWLRKIRFLPISLQDGKVAGGQLSLVVFWVSGDWAISSFGDLNYSYSEKSLTGIFEVEGRYNMSKLIFLAVETEVNNFGEDIETGIAIGLGFKL